MASSVGTSVPSSVGGSVPSSSSSVDSVAPASGTSATAVEFPLSSSEVSVGFSKMV